METLNRWTAHTGSNEYYSWSSNITDWSKNTKNKLSFPKIRIFSRLHSLGSHVHFKILDFVSFQTNKSAEAEAPEQNSEAEALKSVHLGNASNWKRRSRSERTRRNWRVGQKRQKRMWRKCSVHEKCVCTYIPFSIKYQRLRLSTGYSRNTLIIVCYENCYSPAIAGGWWLLYAALQN